MAHDLLRMTIVQPSLSSFCLTLLTTAGLLGATTAGCDNDPPALVSTGGNGSGAFGTGGGGGVFVDQGKELWSGLEADIVTACGACHEPGGLGDAPFLAPPDRYLSVLAWPGIVSLDPTQSKFLTYSVSGGGHSGTNLDGALKDRVAAWLAAESLSIKPGETGTPLLEPFTPIVGFNAVYLTPLDPELTGVAITFTAEELTATSLKLSELSVHTTSKTGVHVVHPVFAVFPKGKPAQADPIDSFSAFDQRYPESTSELMGAGILILTNWEAEAKLGLGFEKVEPYSENMGTGGGGGTPGGGCSDITQFDASAKPQLQQRCLNCHGGGNAGATAALDISDLNTNSALACAQVKNRINLVNPNASQLFITTDPQGNAAHPYKFGGDNNLFNTFRTQVTLWINAE